MPRKIRHRSSGKSPTNDKEGSIKEQLEMAEDMNPPLNDIDSFFLLEIYW
jgi:hypothetical protein